MPIVHLLKVADSSLVGTNTEHWRCGHHEHDLLVVASDPARPDLLGLSLTLAARTGLYSVLPNSSADVMLRFANESCAAAWSPARLRLGAAEGS